MLGGANQGRRAKIDSTARTDQLQRTLALLLPSSGCNVEYATLMNPSTARKITVVIPAYMAAKTIGRAIDSVLAQEDCQVRVIVVINGAGDETAQIARSYGEDRVTVHENAENRGAQFSRNRGLSLVRDELVMFLDADDFVEGPLLAGLAAEMRKVDADLGLGPMQTLLERQGQRGGTTILDVSKPDDLFLDWLAEGRFVAPCSVLWKTSFVRRIGGWDENLRLGDDGELAMRAMLLGARIIGSNLGRGVYVIHNSPHRQTQRSDTLDALLKVPAKLLATETSVVDPVRLRKAAAICYYNAARTCFTRGRDDLGKEALRRSRELGFKGHRGSPLHKFLHQAIGLRARGKLEHAVRRLLARPGG